MILSYNTSRILEIKVQQAFGNYNRWSLNGALDADKFMGNPRSAVDLLIDAYGLQDVRHGDDKVLSEYVTRLTDLCRLDGSDNNADEEFLSLFNKLASHLKENYA